ncbi:hypothetical protein GQX74_003767 [Glossina fuscipes]|nr:hypothetical protein GQX74_003767 [Glossina fuscipes]
MALDSMLADRRIKAFFVFYAYRIRIAAAPFFFSSHNSLFGLCYVRYDEIDRYMSCDIKTKKNTLKWSVYGPYNLPIKVLSKFNSIDDTQDKCASLECGLHYCNKAVSGFLCNTFYKLGFKILLHIPIYIVIFTNVWLFNSTKQIAHQYTEQVEVLLPSRQP